MAIAVPSHITRPQGGRECVAAHNALDISAWIMSYGKERLIMAGQVVEPDGQKPREAVFAYRRGRHQNNVKLILCLFGIDVTPKKK